jgi:hypothetical protein
MDDARLDPHDSDASSQKVGVAAALGTDFEEIAAFLH